MGTTPETHFTVEAPTLIPTTLAIRDFPYSVLLGESVPITFQLIETATGNGVMGKRIVLVLTYPQGGTYKNEGITDVAGFVTITIPGSFIRYVGDHHFYGEFGGDDVYEGCEEELSEVGVFEW